MNQLQLRTLRLSAGTRTRLGSFFSTCSEVALPMRNHDHHKSTSFAHAFSKIRAHHSLSHSSSDVGWAAANSKTYQDCRSDSRMHPCSSFCKEASEWRGLHLCEKAESTWEDCAPAGIEGMSATCRLLLAHGSVCTLPHK